MAKKASKKAADSRQGRRAPTERQTSISINGEILEWARGEATADGRSFSNYVERLLERERATLEGRPVGRAAAVKAPAKKK